jgi:hypothetical protein
MDIFAKQQWHCPPGSSQVNLISCTPSVALLQRATIVVHEEKILVKTEIVKAIITPDKAVLIKGR